MKSGVKDIVGKRIIGVVVKSLERGNAANDQVFLIFDDNTYFEFYGDFSCTSAVDRGGIDEVRRYMSSSYKIDLEHYLPQIIYFALGPFADGRTCWRTLTSRIGQL
jgi:hypothetical protein